MAGEEVWECDFQGMKSYGAYGPRDVLILKGSESLEGPDIVARKKGELTQEDRDRMDSEGIPLECWEDEALLVRARYDKDSRYKKITLIEGDLLETEDILDAIRTIFKQTSQPGVTIHYFGSGKRQTGDWCFQSRFITFSDIVNLYQRHFCGKVLELYCDCSYSGMWVKECRRLLDDCHTQPCGHSARKTDMLVKVRASCLHNQTASTLMFSVRGCGNDKNQGYFFVNEAMQLCPDQKMCDIDSTFITCGRPPNVECLLHPEFTYHVKQCYIERLDVATQVHHGRKAWYLILLQDDENKIREYRRKTQGEGAAINLTEFGKVLESGWGEKPPLELVRDIRIGVKHVHIY